MRPRIVRIYDDLIYIMPGFEHDYGDPFHHMSMMRTVDLDDAGDFIPGTGPSKLQFWLHELLDDIIFYPLQDLMKIYIGDNKVYETLRAILGFFWGLNCGFPPRDVALYTVWDMRGCKPLAVFKKIEGKWEQTYDRKDA